MVRMLQGVLVVSVMALVLPAHASAQGAAAAKPKSATLSAPENVVFNSEVFMQSHPDLLFLRSALGYYRQKKFGKAFHDFDVAAMYGEKMAQAMMAEMLWNGQGVKQDRPRAYALMDIASERMTNPDLVRMREKFWSELTETERKAAVAHGDAVVRKYSDETAMKKLKMAFHADKSSRLRVSPGLLQTLIVGGGEAGEMTMRADEFYDAKFWNPKEYLKIRDDVTNRILRSGKVKVKFGGAVETAPAKGD